MNTQRSTLAMLSVLVVLASLPAAGCGGPGEVSPTAYEYSKSLYAITNRKAEMLLTGVSEQIASDLEANKLSAAEAEMLNTIIEQADDGDWEDANRECRAVMEAQVER